MSATGVSPPTMSVAFNIVLRSPTGSTAEFPGELSTEGRVPATEDPSAVRPVNGGQPMAYLGGQAYSWTENTGCSGSSRASALENRGIGNKNWEKMDGECHLWRSGQWRFWVQNLLVQGFESRELLNLEAYESSQRDALANQALSACSLLHEDVHSTLSWVVASRRRLKDAQSTERDVLVQHECSEFEALCELALHELSLLVSVQRLVDRIGAEVERARLAEDHNRGLIHLDQAESFEWIVAAFYSTWPSDRRVVKARRAYRERIERIDLDSRVGEFFEAIESQPTFADDWEDLAVPAELLSIGLLIGSDPIYDQCLKPYRWSDPTKRQGQKYVDQVGRVTGKAIPPCAVPWVHPSSRRRTMIRSTIGPVWWQTGEEHVTPCPGDYLFSCISRSSQAADERYYSNGDWNLSVVQSIQAGKRTYHLGQRHEVSCGDQTWEFRILLRCASGPRYASLFSGDWVRQLFGNILELPAIRPKMLPLGIDWKKGVDSIKAATVPATISAKYECVIRRTPEHLVAQMRSFKLAALEANQPNVDPVAQLWSLLALEAQAEVELGKASRYAPRS